MSRTRKDRLRGVMPERDGVILLRWSVGLGRFHKRRLSKARRRYARDRLAGRKGRYRGVAHWERECNWKAL